MKKLTASEMRECERIAGKGWHGVEKKHRRYKKVHSRATNFCGMKEGGCFGISREDMARAEQHFWFNPMRPWRAEIFTPVKFMYF